MPTVSIEEAAEKFTELVAKLDAEPLVVMNGDQQVAVITSPDAVEKERLQRWEAFFATSERVAAELKTNLDKEGISVEEFLEDVLRDER